ncbi:MAG TPA: signal peptidase II [Longimicrobiaceae bacterium]|nr:signal peptidase II [Longimicrobiaceae bacterium]
MSSLATRLSRRLQGSRRRHRGGGRRATDREPNRGWIPSLAIALSVAGLDWMVKWSVASHVPLHGFDVVVPGRVALWHVRNPAMILGLYDGLPLTGRKMIAVGAACLGTLVLFEVLSRGHRLARKRRKWAWLFVGLASGGMLGNLGERAFHWGVTDYLSFRWGDIWLPPGNVADVALFLSVPLAAAVIVFELQARAQRRPVSEARAESETVPTSS